MNFLAKTFIKNYDNVSNPQVRIKYGYLSGIIGIITNTILGVLKAILGVVFHSVAVFADGLNNVSDAGSSIVSLVGFKISNMPPDKQHPFGHARVEYVAGLIVACIIIFLSFELLANAIKKCINILPMETSLAMFIVLAVSIVVKFWLGFFNLKTSKKINSLTIKATAIDSFNDCIVTLVVIVCMLINKYANINLDGYTGIIVALFVLITGIRLIKDTLSPLIGEKPTEEFIKNIKDKITSYDGVLGTHDFTAHNYGPGKYFVSVHVEVDAKVDVMLSHDLIDKVEQDLNSENLKLVIHLDPIVIDDPKINEYREMEEKIIESIDSSLSLHDFRAVIGVEHVNLIFDLVVPYKYKYTDFQIIDLIRSKTKELQPKCNVSILIDRN